MIYVLRKYQYHLSTGDYLPAGDTEITSQAASNIADYFTSIRAEIPFFYKWELVNIDTGKVVSKLLAVSDLIKVATGVMEPILQEVKTKEQAIDKVLLELKDEVKRSIKKFGEQNRPPVEWMSILMEEVGEVSQVVVEKEIMHTGRFTWLDYERELIQVATVAINALNSLYRNQLK